MADISCRTCPYCELPEKPDEEEWLCHFSDPIGSSIDPLDGKEPWCSRHPFLLCELVGSVLAQKWSRRWNVDRPDVVCSKGGLDMTEFLRDEDLAKLEQLLKAAWPAPWTAHTFEIDCPCPNGEHCGDSHTCEEVEYREAYPDSHEHPAREGHGQCVVQIDVPGLESLAGPNALFIATSRNMLPALLEELRYWRKR